MNPNDSSPWLQAMESLPDNDGLKARLRQDGIPIEGLGHLRTSEGSERLRQAFDDIFIPSTQHCEIVMRMLGVMNTHYRSFYGDWRAYIQRVDEGRRIEHFPTCICLTGYAGIGKSMLMRSLAQLFSPATFRLNDQYPEVGHVPIKRIRINIQTAELEILFDLANPTLVAGRTRLRKDTLEKHLKAWLYAQGVALLVVDELQFVSLSATANTKVAKILMMLGYLGVPLVFISNYSMATRLMRRPQEERQRLLREPLVLWPDEHDSADWVELVERYIELGPDVFRVSADRDASELWRLTGGIPRLLKELLVIAYGMARDCGRSMVDMDDVMAAFRSTAYFVQRADVEAMASLAVSSIQASKRADLVCPFEPRRLKASNKEAHPSKRETKPPSQAPEPTYAAVEHMVMSAASVDLRRAVDKHNKELERTTDGSSIATSAKPRTKKLALTPENLYAGAAALRGDTN